MEKKKVTCKDLEGLRQLFPENSRERVLPVEGVGAGMPAPANASFPGDYYGGDGYGSSGIADNGYYGYGGLGYYDDSYWLDEFVVYGKKPDDSENTGYPCPYPGDDFPGNGYPGMEGDSDMEYGYPGQDDSDPEKYWVFKKVDDGQCIVGAIINAAGMLGIELDESDVKSDLESYWISNMNRYAISDDQMKDVLGKYFDVTVTNHTSEANKAVVRNKPVIMRLVHERKDVKPDESEESDLTLTIEQLHDVVIIGVNNGSNSYFEYYDPVEGEVERITEKELKIANITGHFYIVAPKDND